MKYASIKHRANDYFHPHFGKSKLENKDLVIFFIFSLTMEAAESYIHGRQHESLLYKLLSWNSRKLQVLKASSEWTVLYSKKAGKVCID